MYEVNFNGKRYEFPTLAEASQVWERFNAELDMFDELFPVSLRNGTELQENLYPAIPKSFYRLREQDRPDWDEWNG